MCPHGVPRKAYCENCGWGCPEGCHGDHHAESCTAGASHRVQNLRLETALRSGWEPTSTADLDQFLYRDLTPREQQRWEILRVAGQSSGAFRDAMNDATPEERQEVVRILAYVKSETPKTLEISQP